MTTRAIPYRHASSLPTILAAMLIILVVAMIAPDLIGGQVVQPPLPTLGYDIPGLGEIQCGTHADVKHGEDAAIAREMVRARPNCQHCADGLWRCTASGDGMSAVVILAQTISGMFYEVSAFLTGHQTVEQVERDCAPSHNGHDNFVSGAAY